MQEYWIYLIPLGAVAYFIWSKRSASESQVKALMEKGAQIVDVRSKAEFKAAAHSKSINIPLDELEKGAKKLDPAKPVLVCCATGIRSASAVAVLTRMGFKEVLNIGTWQRIRSLLP